MCIFSGSANPLIAKPTTLVNRFDNYKFPCVKATENRQQATVGIIVYSQINYTNISDSPVITEQFLENDPAQILIVGLWRGYHETPDFTIYYGYEFRPNGVYVARHRVYQQQETILDQYWQGKWQFDGKILSLEGTITNGDSTQFNYSFILNENNLLSYHTGNLPEPYLPARMGKVSAKR